MNKWQKFVTKYLPEIIGTLFCIMMIAVILAITVLSVKLILFVTGVIP